MSFQGEQHLKNLKNSYRRRLEILEIQAAKFGYSTPPHVLIEIEDIQKKLESIRIQISESKTESQSSSEEIKILFLAAVPKDTFRLRLDEELREIKENLQLSQLRDKFKLSQYFAVRSTDISRALLDTSPNIVHFSGHGIHDGALYLENQLGELHPVSPDALESLFKQFNNQVECVVLNACYSEIQATAISKHISYVVGMNQKIQDKAAIAFSVGFYQALGAGQSFEKAYELGCVQIKLQNSKDPVTPVLIRNSEAEIHSN